MNDLLDMFLRSNYDFEALSFRAFEETVDATPQKHTPLKKASIGEPNTFHKQENK